jgi:hypothetical protein
VSDDDHVTDVRARLLPSLNVPVAVKDFVNPAATVGPCGLTAIVVSVAGGVDGLEVGGVVVEPPPPPPQWTRTNEKTAKTRERDR